MGLTPEEERKLTLKHSDDLLKKVWYRVVLDEGHAIKNYSSASMFAECTREN